MLISLVRSIIYYKIKLDKSLSSRYFYLKHMKTTFVYIYHVSGKQGKWKISEALSASSKLRIN